MDGHNTGKLIVNYQDLQGSIKSSYETLPKQLKKLASFAVSNPEEMALSTLAELAEATGSHPSTFVRLSKQLGFSGFSEMQSIYRSNLRGTLKSYKGRLQAVQPDDIREVLDLVVDTAQLSLSKLLETLDVRQWQDMLSGLSGANTIWLAAAGRSAVIMDYAHYLLTNMGVNSRRVSPYSGIAIRELELIRPDDYLLAMSMQPYSEDTAHLVATAHEMDRAVFTITDTQISPIFNEACLLINENDYAGFRSMSAGMALIQTMAIELGKRRAHQDRT